jgi:hypothetical protein
MADSVQEVDLSAVRFAISSFCSADGCVEVGRLADGQVAVRDSKDRGRPALIFTADEWTAFLKGARAGEFD